MKKILKQLQDLQSKAIEKGIYSFFLDVMNGRAGIVITVCVMLKPGNEEDDYLCTTLYESHEHRDNIGKVELIKWFCEL